MQINSKINNYTYAKNNYPQKNNNPSFGYIEVEELPKPFSLRTIQQYSLMRELKEEAKKCPARTRIYLEDSRLHASISYYDGNKKWFLGRHKAKRKEDLCTFAKRMHYRTLKHMEDFNNGRIPRQTPSLWEKVKRYFEEPRGEW